MVVVVITLLLVVADYGLRAMAENAAADLIDKEVPQRVEPSVGLGGFPFLLSVLRGSFDQVTVSMPRARQGSLVVEDINLIFDDVELEALEVLGGRGTLRAESLRGSGAVSEASLNRVIDAEAPGVSATIDDDRIALSRGDVAVPATAIVANEEILIRAGEIGPIVIPLPTLLPEIRFSSLETRRGELVLGVRALDVRIRA